MLLKKLYTEPSEIFAPIVFKNGVNFIYAKKDSDTDSKKSLNGVGKSTCLDLVDFCLGSSFQSNHSPRLFAAKNILDNYQICLDFEIDGILYTAKRSTKKAAEILLGSGDELTPYADDDFRKKMADMIFKDDSYSGRFNNVWFRSLITFYLKIQKPKRSTFSDPIKYIKEATFADLNRYHFYLLGIDNDLSCKNFDIVENLKEKAPALRGVKRLIEEKFDVANIGEARNFVETMKNQIQRLERAAGDFELAEQYGDVEKQADELTSQIKTFWLDGHAEKRKLEQYVESTKNKETLSSVTVQRITRIYAEADKVLSEGVRNSLNEAVDFRKRLIESRKEFLAVEMDRLKKSIAARAGKIKELEEKRAALYRYLTQEEAIKDLADAYSRLDRKRTDLTDINGYLNAYDQFEYEKLDLENELASLVIDIKKWIKEIQKSEQPEINQVFLEIFNSIYPRDGQPVFNFVEALDTDARVDIRVKLPGDYSEGINKARSLVYDLSVLFHAIKLNIRTPRFLVHDGIFDGMDKAQFVYLVSFLDKMAEDKEFQYIVTLNEEGHLKENFGPSDRVKKEQIEKEAVLLLSPSRKLIGDFAQ